MKTGQKQQKKGILSDPVAALNKHFSNANKEQIERLTSLQKARSIQKARYQVEQDQARKISREIGHAKQNNAPIKTLKNEMQERSSRLKTLSNQLQDIEKEILSYFKQEDESDDPSNINNEACGVNYGVNVDYSSAPPQIERKYPNYLKRNREISVSLMENNQVEVQKDWNSYVASNPATSIYHRIEWKELIQNTFGHKCYYFLARDSKDSIIGILPLVRLKSTLFGDFLVSMPYFNYGGAIANSPDIEQLLMDTANTHAAELGVSHIEYRDDTPRSELPVRTDKVNMILSLPKHEDDLWHNFSSKLRAQIKRPQRENPRVMFGGKELLNDFYDVFARNMRDLGTPVYGKSFFHNILQQFPGQSRIIVLRLSDRPVAAAFLIGHTDTLEIPWASTIQSVNHLSMNMLMYWEVLKFAIDDGYHNFDFGRSSKASGTFRFKKQWGAMPKPLFWHYWLAHTENLPSLNPSNPKFAIMIAAWKCLPVSVSKILGPWIVKNLP